MLPSTSVVIPVLNGAHTIGDTLAGLMNQAASPPEIEIIVVDNGSTDGTTAVVQKFPVMLLCEPKPGPSAARNRGLRQVRGEVVAFLDADTLPTRHWLAEIAAPFADPEILLVAGRLIGYRPQTTAEKYYAHYFLDQTARHAQLASFPFAASGNMAVRRNVVTALGGWDEEFRVGEDIDLAQRLLRKFNTHIHAAPAALVFLRIRADREALNRQAFKYGQGGARLWMRYPEVAEWNALHLLRVVGGLALISTYPVAVRMAQVAGRASDEDIAMAQYHRSWSWWYWRGFYSMLRTHEWRLD